MKSPVITKEKVNINTTDEVLYFGLRAGAVVCAVVGLWALSCLASAVFHAGPLAVIRGYITAITGV